MDRMDRIRNDECGMRNDELRPEAQPSYSSFRIPHSSFLIPSPSARLLFQLDDGRARAALIVGGEVEALDVRVRAQEFGDGAAQSARAVAVDDSDVGVAVQICFVQKFINVVARLVRRPADEVEFGVCALARVFEFYLRALLLHAAQTTDERVVVLLLPWRWRDEFEVRELFAEA